jgi:hypothetical protein
MEKTITVTLTDEELDLIHFLLSNHCDEADRILEKLYDAQEGRECLRVSDSAIETDPVSEGAQ